MQITFENCCLAYNGYTHTPEYFSGRRCCRAVVPQSFAFDPAAVLAWDIKHGNTQNPWNLPAGKASQSFVGQLRQSSIRAQCDAHFHQAAFFKFCVNNAANLLSVIKTRCCRDLVCPPPRCPRLAGGHIVCVARLWHAIPAHAKGLRAADKYLLLKCVGC